MKNAEKQSYQLPVGDLSVFSEAELCININSVTIVHWHELFVLYRYVGPIVNL